MSNRAIGDYALLSDCRSAALVSRGGSVDWLCFPRFDAPSVFARLLDAEAGHFSVRPAGEVEVSRAYLDQTMALETTFRTPTGVAVLVDALAVGRNDRGHDLGAGSPGVLLRRITCTDGQVEVEVSYAPRPEYGLIHPLLERVPGGPDGEVPGVTVQQPAEDARGVEAGEAQPVHRPAPADQCGRAAVGQQGVVADRERAHRRFLSWDARGRTPPADGARPR